MFAIGLGWLVLDRASVSWFEPIPNNVFGCNLKRLGDDDRWPGKRRRQFSIGYSVVQRDVWDRNGRNCRSPSAPSSSIFVLYRTYNCHLNADELLDSWHCCHEDHYSGQRRSIVVSPFWLYCLLKASCFFLKKIMLRHFKCHHLDPLSVLQRNLY